MSTIQPETRAPSDVDAFSYDDLLACAEGRMFGANGPRLPLPPMLMFDRIDRISRSGGAYGKGVISATLNIDPSLWFFDCHFRDDPVMPGCLGLDAFWQLIGFFLGWMGATGRGRALGVGKVRFSGMVLPHARQTIYRLDMKRVLLGRLVMGVADAAMLVDGEEIYTASDLRVGLFAHGAQMSSKPDA